jgi:hypothetical protein
MAHIHLLMSLKCMKYMCVNDYKLRQIIENWRLKYSHATVISKCYLKPLSFSNKVSAGDR